MIDKSPKSTMGNFVPSTHGPVQTAFPRTLSSVSTSVRVGVGGVGGVQKWGIVRGEVDLADTVLAPFLHFLKRNTSSRLLQI